MQILITLKGYVCDVCCGKIPIDAIRAITGMVRPRRTQAEAGTGKPSAQSVITELWYKESQNLKLLLADFGLNWNGFMSINHFGHYCGIGSGKDGLGVFEMEIYEGEELLLTFIPPPVQPELKERFMGLDKIRIKTIDSPPLPYAGEGFVPISSGLWGIGTIEFRLEKGPRFDPENLELVTMDLCDIGIGEDCLTTGLIYNGRDIPGIPSPGPSREPYPAVWYSQGEKKWLDLGDASTF